MSSTHYAGIGSRETPMAIQFVMTQIATKLSDKYTLRAGDAAGADAAFGAGTKKKEVYTVKSFKDSTADIQSKARTIAKNYHPVWYKLAEYSRMLHARNAFQILGPNLDDPVRFVVCWTPDGCVHHQSRTIATGGTGTAISIASSIGIPVFNLANKDHLARITTELGIPLLGKDNP